MQKLEYTVTEPHAPDATVRGTLADLVLDAYLIPRCGLIPPFVVLQERLRTGGGNAGMSPGCKWEPFEITESDYSDMVGQLEALAPEDLTMRHRNPQIVAEIRPDYGAGASNNWREWTDSLVHRGLLPGDPFREVRR
jgi:hypothetical protein